MTPEEAMHARERSPVPARVRGSPATRVARAVLRRLRLEGLMDVWSLGILRSEGWRLSYRLGRPVDASGEPIPWYTYGCRDFLGERLTSKLRVFEFGAGNSTLWYAQKVSEVVAVEHDESWATEVTAAAPANVRVLRRDLGDSYTSAASDAAPYDLIAIDGMLRPACAEAAVHSLTATGVLIWDNSDWQEFRLTFPRLAEKGFRELPFSGLGPINRDKWRTSVLYRDQNCLGI